MSIDIVRDNTINFSRPSRSNRRIIRDIIFDKYCGNSCINSYGEKYYQIKYRGDEYIYKGDHQFKEYGYTAALHKMHIVILENDKYFKIDIRYITIGVTLHLDREIIIDCSYYSLEESLIYILENITKFIE